MATVKSNFGELLRIDLHDLALHQAKVLILETLKKAINGTESGLYIIHGFNSGDKIKTYIRGGALANSLRDRGIHAKITSFRGNPGTSGIILVDSDAGE